MLRRELDTLRRHQIDERRMRLGQMRMHGIHHLAQRMGAGNGQYPGMDFLDDIVPGGVFFGAQTTGDDYLAVLIEGFADCVERLLDRGIDESTGIDDDQIGAVIRLGGVIAFGAQLGENLFRIYQRLGAAE